MMNREVAVKLSARMRVERESTHTRVAVFHEKSVRLPISDTSIAYQTPMLLYAKLKQLLLFKHRKVA